MSEPIVQRLTEFPSVIDPDKVPAEWENEMSSARVNVALATIMISYMTFRCRFHFTEDPRIETAAAMPYDGENHLFFNPHFFFKTLKSTNERAFVVLHEVLHIFLEHCGRAFDQGYDWMLWNIATDYVINLFASGAYLDENGKVEYALKYQRNLSRPAKVLYDERFIGMSADEVYWILLDEHDGDAQAAAAAHGGDGEGNQVPLDGLSDSSGDAEQQGRNRQTAAGAISTAAQSNAIGDNEGSMAQKLYDMSKPVVPWYEILDDAVTASTRERYTYNRLSNREGDGGVVFPSMTGKKINVVFGFDSSGSMNVDDYADVVAELSSVIEQFTSWHLRLLSCDTKPYVLGEYDADEGDELASMDLTAHGIGGTFLNPMVEYANDLVDAGEEINACIILTDGHLSPGDLQSCSDEITNIVVVTRNGNKNYTHDDAIVIHMGA